MSEPWHEACYARTRELAAEHCSNDDIAGELVVDFGLSWDVATRYVADNSDTIRALRCKFRNDLRKKANALWRGDEKAKDGYQVTVLAKSVENYLGWKPTEDSKRQAKQGPRGVVNGGKAA